jgi:hypothetical protein
MAASWLADVQRVLPTLMASPKVAEFSAALNVSANAARLSPERVAEP